MPKGSNVLFLAETIVRENTVLKDAKEYKKFYGIDPLKGYKFKFASYQGAYKYSIKDYFPNATEDNTLICLDEVHDLISSERFKFVQNSDLQNNKIPRLGLSATIDKKTLYLIQNLETTKFDLLKTFCPVVYTYSLQESMDNKTTRDIKFFVISNELDDHKRNIQAGLAKQRFYTTEKANYAHLDRDVRLAMFSKAVTQTEIAQKKWKVINAATRRARFLYSLPSKLEKCKELVSKIKGKTLVFGQDSNSLLDICPTAIVSDNKNYVKDLENFKLGKTQLTCSNKILKQGENIPGLENLILFAYYSKMKDFVQMMGGSLPIILFNSVNPKSLKIWEYRAKQGFKN